MADGIQALASERLVPIRSNLVGSISNRAIVERRHPSVQILSGRNQHGRDSSGNLLSSDESTFETVVIGSDCWIGAGAIVMADVGSGTTIGAGAIVVKPIPPGTVAVGNPARVIKTIGEPVH